MGDTFQELAVRGLYVLHWKTLGRWTLFLFFLWYQESWRPGLDPWIGKLPWRREWQPTPALLPGEFRGQKSLAGYSPWGGTVGHDWAANTFIFTFKKRAEERTVMNEEFLRLWGGNKSCSTAPWSWFRCWRNSVADLREVLHLSLRLTGVPLSDTAPLHWVEPELLVSMSPRPCGHVANTCAYRDARPHASAKIRE